MGGVGEINNRQFSDDIPAISLRRPEIVATSLGENQIAVGTVTQQAGKRPEQP